MSLSPEIETAALNETERALRDLVQAAINIGLPKMSMAMMMRDMADELESKVKVIN